MELTDLVGEHLLQGVNHTVERFEDWIGTSEDANVIRFKLDNKVYQAIEDKDDGYRSYCKELVEIDEPIQYEFPPQTVIARMRENNSYEENKVLEFIDPVTNLQVLAIGTGNTNDYYPYCVLEWNPENMAVNQNVKDGE